MIAHNLNSWFRTVCCLAVFIFFSSAVFACSLWEHRWRLLNESREYTPSDEVFEMWKVWFQRTYNKAPLPVQAYSDRVEAHDAEVASSGHTILQPSQYEEYRAWKVDDALLPVPVLRWEYLTRTHIRWVAMDSSGKIETIDEVPLNYGWSQTIVLWPMACPIVAFQRINSIDSTTDLFSLLTWLLPGAADVASKSFDF